MILDHFAHNGGVVEIHLVARREPAGSCAIVPRWRGGDAVCGFEYCLDELPSACLKAAARIEVIKHLAAQARQGIASGQWEKWERMIAA